MRVSPAMRSTGCDCTAIIVLPVMAQREWELVGMLPMNRGVHLRYATWGGGQRDSLAIYPETAPPIHASLGVAGHGHDPGGPLIATVCRLTKVQGDLLA